MATSPLDSIKREYVHPVFPCHLCKAQFFSTVERNDHLETHFTRQQCPSCSQTLILIDAELFVLSPHLPSQCLKQIAAKRQANGSKIGESEVGLQQAQNERAQQQHGRRKKSILSEPNILVDGPMNGIRIRNRKSNRIKEKYFAQVEAALEDDENENSEQELNDNETEKIFIEVKSRPDAWMDMPNIVHAPRLNKNSSVIEVFESDDDDKNDVKSEIDEDEIDARLDVVEQPKTMNQTIDAGTKTRRSRSTKRTKSKLLNANEESNCSTILPDQMQAGDDDFPIQYLEDEFRNENDSSEVDTRNASEPNENPFPEDDVVKTIRDLITNNVSDFETITTQILCNNLFGTDSPTDQLTERRRTTTTTTTSTTTTANENFIAEEISIDDVIKDETDIPDETPNSNLISSESRKKSSRKSALPSTKPATELPNDIEEKYNGNVFCDLCDEAMPKNHIVNHIRFVHHGIRTQSDRECDLCGYVCSTVSNLRQHRRRHTEPKRFTCSYCGKGFNGRFHLNEHINIHTGNRPHTCEFCFKTFSRLTLKVSHLRTHTGERPFRCKILGCERDFRYNTDLRRHEHRVHSIWYKKHECHVCNKIFPERKLLRKHLKRHLAA